MEFSDLNILRGTLKQQCLDNQGLYVWEKKTFYLDIPNKTLTVTSSSVSHSHDAITDNVSPINGMQTSISLRGAKYAKEWSFSSTLTGFGFDLVWSSGKIWSFLVDDQETCKKWVDFLNISLSLDDDDNPWKALISTSPDHMEKPPKPPVHESSKNSSSQEVKSEYVDKGNQYSTAQAAASLDMLSTVYISPSAPSSSQRSTISIDPNITSVPQSTRYSSQRSGHNDDADSIGSLANSNRTDISFQESPPTKTKTQINNSVISSPLARNMTNKTAASSSSCDTPTSALDSAKPPLIAMVDVPEYNRSSLSNYKSAAREASHATAQVQKSGPSTPAIELRLLSNRHGHHEPIQQQLSVHGGYDPLTEERYLECDDSSDDDDDDDDDIGY